MHNVVVTFCQDRRSWLFVVAGTLLLILLLLMPAVDDYGALCAEKSELADQLALAEKTVAQAPLYETRLAEKANQLAAARAKTLDESQLSDFRNALVKMVRDSGCQLVRLSIGNAQSQNWVEGDTPLVRNQAKKSRETGFQLEKRVVSLALAGTTTNIRRLMENMEKSGKLMHIEGVDLRPTGPEATRAELSLDLWYFALVRNEKA